MTTDSSGGYNRSVRGIDIPAAFAAVGVMIAVFGSSLIWGAAPVGSGVAHAIGLVLGFLMYPMAKWLGAGMEQMLEEVQTDE